MSPGIYSLRKATRKKKRGGEIFKIHLKPLLALDYALEIMSMTPLGVLKFELGTDVRPEVSTTTL